MVLLRYPSIDRRTRRFVPTLWVAFPALLFVIAVVYPVYAIANFPPGRPFEERLALPTATPQEEQAYRQFRLLSRAEGADTAEQRENLVEFLAQNVVSVPEDELNDRGRDAGFPDYGSLLTVGSQVDLDEVSQMVGDGDFAGARRRYIQLWRVSESLISGRGWLLQHLMGAVIASHLAEGSLKDDEIMRLAHDDEILAIAAVIAEVLDDSFARALALEHLSLSRGVVLAGDETWGNLQGIPFPWPFFDRYKTLKIHHDAIYAAIALSGQPSLSEEDRQVYQVMFDKPAKRSYLHNPAGSLIVSVIAEDILRFYGTPENTKATISEFIDAAGS
jgi:hypothetical protein